MTLAEILNIIVPALAIFVSVILSNRIYIRHEQRTRKLDLIDQLTSLRHENSSDMNIFLDKIPVAFVKSKIVMKEYSRYYRVGKGPVALFKLYQAMCSDVKLPSYSQKFFERK